MKLNYTQQVDLIILLETTIRTLKRSIENYERLPGNDFEQRDLLQWHQTQLARYESILNTLKAEWVLPDSAKIGAV